MTSHRKTHCAPCESSWSLVSVLPTSTCRTHRQEHTLKIKLYMFNMIKQHWLLSLRTTKRFRSKFLNCWFSHEVPVVFHMKLMSCQLSVTVKRSLMKRSSFQPRTFASPQTNVGHWPEKSCCSATGDWSFFQDGSAPGNALSAVSCSVDSVLIQAGTQKRRIPLFPFSLDLYVLVHCKKKKVFSVF